MTSKRCVYSDLEKQVFLDILKKYKHVIESKGTNSSTLKEKSEAWSIITEEYNNSSLICTKVLNLFDYFCIHVHIQVYMHIYTRARLHIHNCLMFF